MSQRRPTDDYWESLEEQERHNQHSAEKFIEYQRRQFEKERRDARWEKVQEMMDE